MASSKYPDTGIKKSRQSHNNKVPPDAPRRNLSSFVLFANARRKELKVLYPDRPYPAIQSDISVEWEQMDDAIKEPWRKAMELDKERYKKEMDLYRKYGSGWVWVVGHRMRRNLGLTDEDCTRMELASSTDEQSDGNMAPEIGTNAQEGCFADSSEHCGHQAIEMGYENDGQGDAFDGYSPVSTSALSNVSSCSKLDVDREPAMQYYSIPTPRSHGAPDILGASAHSRSDTVTLGSELAVQKSPPHGYIEPSFEEQLFLPGQQVDIFSPTVFDGFGFEVLWNETYGWYSPESSG